MRRPIFFRQLKSHLEDPKYKEIGNLISEIEVSEPKHNKNVADLMNNIRVNMRNAIYSRDDNRQTDHIKERLREFDKSDANYLPHFILDHIIEYYVDKAIGKNTALRIRQTNTDVFQLIKEADFPIAIGVGDEQTMNWLLNKIESLPIAKQIQELHTEGIRINNLFNDKLISKTKDLIVDIEDERFLDKCDFESST
jgi:hypothetical protein